MQIVEPDPILPPSYCLLKFSYLPTVRQASPCYFFLIV